MMQASRHPPWPLRPRALLKEREGRLRAAASRLPRPHRSGGGVAWALVISGVSCPSAELDLILDRALPVLGTGVSSCGRRVEAARRCQR